MLEKLSEKNYTKDLKISQIALFNFKSALMYFRDSLAVPLLLYLKNGVSFEKIDDTLRHFPTPIIPMTHVSIYLLFYFI